MPEIEGSQDIEKLGSAEYWLEAVQTRHAALEDWHKKAWQAIERYRDEKRKKNALSTQFNILFANTRILKPALYSRSPVPDVRRRYTANDPVAKAVSEIIERSLSYHMDRYDFDSIMSAVVEDYALPGLGVAVVGYNPVFGESVTPKEPVEPSPDGVYEDGVEIDETGMPYRPGEEYQPVIDEYTTCEYWFWQDFCFGAARKWADVPWVAFRSFMTREDLMKLAPDVAKDVNLDWSPKSEDKKKEKDEYKRATVWKIWDKTSRKVRYVSPGLPGRELKVEDDPLKLEGFFPCPRPVISVSTNDTMMPIPFYCIYEDQARELDIISERITKLSKRLQAKGIYNAAHKQAMGLLNDAEDNSLIPIAVHGAESLDMTKMVAYWPIEKIATVLASLYQQREAVKGVIYEIMGISDIVRGATNPNETLGAQQIKSNYATLTLQDMQQEVQRFARDILRLKAEVICEQFSPETLKRMVGEELFFAKVPTPQGEQQVDITDQIMQIMRDDKLRSYRIDVETDSTIQPNMQEEQKNFTEMVTAVTQMVTSWAPLVQGGMVPADVPKTLMLSAVRRFKGSREIEGAIEQIGTQKEPQQPPQPSDAEIAMQGKKMEIEADIMMNREDNQTEIQKEQIRQQGAVAREQFKPRMI